MGTSFLRAAAHDDDQGSNAAITYSLSSQKPAYLHINPSTGWVYVNHPISQVSTNSGSDSIECRIGPVSILSKCILLEKRGPSSPPFTSHWRWSWSSGNTNQSDLVQVFQQPTPALPIFPFVCVCACVCACERGLFVCATLRHNVLYVHLRAPARLCLAVVFCVYVCVFASPL